MLVRLVNEVHSVFSVLFHVSISGTQKQLVCCAISDRIIHGEVKKLRKKEEEEETIDRGG